MDFSVLAGQTLLLDISVSFESWKLPPPSRFLSCHILFDAWPKDGSNDPSEAATAPSDGRHVAAASVS